MTTTVSVQNKNTLIMIKMKLKANGVKLISISNFALILFVVLLYFCSCVPTTNAQINNNKSPFDDDFFKKGTSFDDIRKKHKEDWEKQKEENDEWFEQKSNESWEIFKTILYIIGGIFLFIVITIIICITVPCCILAKVVGRRGRSGGTTHAIPHPQSMAGGTQQQPLMIPTQGPPQPPIVYPNAVPVPGTYSPYPPQAQGPYNPIMTTTGFMNQPPPYGPPGTIGFGPQPPYNPNFHLEINT